MKKIALFMALLVLILPLFGFGWRSTKKYTVSDFEDRLYALATDPESVVDLDLRYSKVDNWEDAITNIAGYISKDWYVSESLAEDSWIYLNQYIESLERELVVLNDMYSEAF